MGSGAWKERVIWNDGISTAEGNVCEEKMSSTGSLHHMSDVCSPPFNLRWSANSKSFASSSHSTLGSGASHKVISTGLAEKSLAAPR